MQIKHSTLLAGETSQALLMVCACENKCNPSYLEPSDLKGLNVLLHHFNEEGDIVHTNPQTQ